MDDPPDVSEAGLLDREIDEFFLVKAYVGKNPFCFAVLSFNNLVVIIYELASQVGSSNTACTVREKDKSDLEVVEMKWLLKESCSA